ncbi:MAG: prepilin-type N-terminal cleavage/methylation domain-containing protein [Pseudomonadota bacterium]
MPKRQSGFTLIELMIVIAIIGILASIAVPSYRDYVRKSNAAEALALLKTMSDKAIHFYNVNGTFPFRTSTIAAWDSSVSATETDYATDVVHSIHFRNDVGPANSGQVWVRLNGGVFGPSGRRHLRAVLQDRGGIITVDWCDQTGGWPTETDIWHYFDCP